MGRIDMGPYSKPTLVPPVKNARDYVKLPMIKTGTMKIDKIGCLYNIKYKDLVSLDPENYKSRSNKDKTVNPTTVTDSNGVVYRTLDDLWVDVYYTLIPQIVEWQRNNNRRFFPQEVYIDTYDRSETIHNILGLIHGGTEREEKIFTPVLINRSEYRRKFKNGKKRNNPKAKEYLYNRTKIIPDDCFMIDEVMYIKVSNRKGNNYMRVKITPTYSSDNVTSDTSNLEKTDEGTEIKSVKKVTREGIERTVYEGYCDGIPTKWVTIGEWDFEITLRACNGEMLYTDSHGNEMLVFEDDEDGWYKW